MPAMPIRVLDYHEHAIGGGADAQRRWPTSSCASASAPLFGVGIDRNIVSASLKAIVSGLRARTGAERPCHGPSADHV